MFCLVFVGFSMFYLFFTVYSRFISSDFPMDFQRFSVLQAKTPTVPRLRHQLKPLFKKTDAWLHPLTGTTS